MLVDDGLYCEGEHDVNAIFAIGDTEIPEWDTKVTIILGGEPGGLAWLRRMVDYLRATLRGGLSVLVTSPGQPWAATVCAAYLVRQYHLDVPAALAWLERSTEIRLEGRYVDELLAYQGVVQGKLKERSHGCHQ